MNNIEKYEVWYITGSQNLYGENVLQQVSSDSKIIASALDNSPVIPVRIILKPIVCSTEDILATCKQANASSSCVGIITWMHTFSPAKMWINGLKILSKPILHLHTQFNREIPWDKIDMDFMNLNQSAHGGREFGFITSRMCASRKIVVGHWSDPDVVSKIAVWTRVASAKANMELMNIARLGDNMREVAVTEGNKVNAQIQFGFSVNGYGLSDLMEHVKDVSSRQIDQLVENYQEDYIMGIELQRRGARHSFLREAAKIELGLRSFLVSGSFHAFTDTFENLNGLSQLPGIAVQRLMADGYGFAAEGDWKTAALVRCMKVMSSGLDGGVSFMEDYTYHFGSDENLVLGSHMLEICPSITNDKPRCEIHPLAIGGKTDPVRLVFTATPGPSLNASLIDLGTRFRLIVNEMETIKPPFPMPKLPVAKALWSPKPDFKTATTAWILAGGAHHSSYSQNLTSEYLEDFAEMTGIEFTLIDDNIDIRRFKQDIRANEIYYLLSSR